MSNKGNFHKKSVKTWDLDPTGVGGGSGPDTMSPNPYFDFSVNFVTSKMVFIQFNLWRYMISWPPRGHPGSPRGHPGSPRGCIFSYDQRSLAQGLLVFVSPSVR